MIFDGIYAIPHYLEFEVPSETNILSEKAMLSRGKHSVFTFSTQRCVWPTVFFRLTRFITSCVIVSFSRRPTTSRMGYRAG
jgi:hypothetical protein